MVEIVGGDTVYQMDNGDLDIDRYQNYLKLQKELERLEIRKSGSEAYFVKMKDKRLAQMIKEVKKLKGHNSK